MPNLDSPLGKTPNGWRVASLKEITTKIGSGATPSGGQSAYLARRHNFALIRSQNIFDRFFDPAGLAFISDKQAAQLQGARVQPGDLLLNITGDGVTFARATQVPLSILPACVNQHVAIIRPKPQECCSGYLLSYLTHPMIKTYIESFNAGGSRRAITKGHIESFIVPLPPLAEQRAIASILGSLDDKIELNRQMNKTLEAIAQAIFKSWFIDFDPVRAKMEGREPYGMDAETAALFPDGFEDSALGEIPRGWKAGSLADVATILMGQSPPGETYNEQGEGLPFYQGVRDFGFRFPSRRVYCTDPTRMAEKGTVFLSVRAPVGSLNIATERCAIGRGIAGLTSKVKGNSYLYYLLKASHAGWQQFEADGTVFGAASKNDVHNFAIIKPPEKLMECFNQLIGPFDARIESNERETATLTILRDTLLPKLISGQIRVREAEKVVQAHV